MIRDFVADRPEAADCLNRRFVSDLWQSGRPPHGDQGAVSGDCGADARQRRTRRGCLRGSLPPAKSPARRIVVAGLHPRIIPRMIALAMFTRRPEIIGGPPW